jgi:5-(carboxyamino)imidazole ribonucleotide mutase
MPNPLVGVVIGSRADFSIMKRGLETLRTIGVPYRLEMAPAHRTPGRLRRFAERAEGEGFEVIICAAGGSAPVAAILASHTTLPVIAVPIDSTPLRGQDALMSMVQTAPGIPVATVGINNGENAALLAAQILALKHPGLRTSLRHMRETSARRVDAAFAELLEEFPELCDPLRTAPPIAAPRMRNTEEDTDPGPEDATPDPPEFAPAPAASPEPIRPGAQLAEPAAQARAAGPGWLVSTPEPQEPGIVTEDGEIAADLGAPRPPAPPSRGPETPPPPSLRDLAPARPDASPATDLLAAVVEAPEPEPQPPPPIDTKIFAIDHESPDEDILDHAMMVLLEGGIVALPTDTVYGLAADATNTAAIARLYGVKGRDTHAKSLSILIPSPDMLDRLVREVPAAVESVIENLWPGGLTIVFYKHPDVLASISDSPSIALRIPRDEIPLGLMRKVGRPLAVINAATSERPTPATNAHDVTERFYGRIECVLDAGPCRSAQPSTVLSVLAEPFEILREGAIPRRDLKKILGDKLKD